MKNLVVNEKTNEQVRSVLNEFPNFALRCKLGEIMRDRGIKLSELSDLTGIRQATLSEMINMRRTTLNVIHVITLAATLRITDLSELFTFVYDEATKERFDMDNEYIEHCGVTAGQDIFLAELRKMRTQQKSPSND